MTSRLAVVTTILLLMIPRHKMFHMIYGGFYMLICFGYWHLARHQWLWLLPSFWLLEALEATFCLQCLCGSIWERLWARWANDVGSIDAISEEGDLIPSLLGGDTSAPRKLASGTTTREFVLKLMLGLRQEYPTSRMMMVEMMEEMYVWRIDCISQFWRASSAYPTTKWEYDIGKCV